ncbi:DUF6624 domain-containing protein [Streptomyces sp. NPDC059786]|uniref:DUF6624 domain-containing protein n=1 Tax=Streptomyces sp. NPDC059786 TaxID=3346946 RepID=UPI00365BF620
MRTARSTPDDLTDGTGAAAASRPPGETAGGTAGDTAGGRRPSHGQGRRHGAGRPEGEGAARRGDAPARAGDDAPDADPGTDTDAETPDASARAAGAPAPRPMPAALTVVLAGELLRRAEKETRLMREAQANPAPGRRRAINECRSDNADALTAVVRRYGWPTADQVGPAASTAALMILLHTRDLDFQLLCRDLIAQAAADGRCSAAQHAYIADHCAVELGEPQYYGTRVNPVTLRPYAVRRPGTLEERRRDVGLCPLEEQLRTLRRTG